jgi:predicted glycosyltransferase
MKIAFHIAHPAQFHLFKNIAGYFAHSQKHQVIVTYNEKDVLHYLIKNSQLSGFSKNIEAKGSGSRIYSLFFQFIKKEFNLLKILKKEKPDLILGTSIIIAHVGKLLKIPAVIVNEDDYDYIPLYHNWGYPLATTILAPGGCRMGKWEYKAVHYAGYHELTYLHPALFQPERKKVEHLFKEKDRYFILRLVKLGAHHDKGRRGINFEIALKIIQMLEKYGHVYITAERPLESRLEKYRININPIDIHDVLYFSDIFIGDSQSMTMETAVLGVPSIRFNDFAGEISVLDELENKYQLACGIRTSQQEKLYAKIQEFLDTPNLKNEYRKRTQKMFSEKINVTAFMVWFIENYPGSVNVMKENPDYQWKFKWEVENIL